jgi:hypothetical protein
MTSSSRTRRWIAPAVLVSYLLTATMSGLLHNHGAGGECCGDKVCGLVAAHDECSHPPGKHHHHHHHPHGACSESTAPQETKDSGKAPRRQPGRNGPLRHDDCAACRFLAQQSVTAPRIALESTATLVALLSDAVEARVPAIVANAHPARGPPCRG